MSAWDVELRWLGIAAIALTHRALSLTPQGVLLCLCLRHISELFWASFIILVTDEGVGSKLKVIQQTVMEVTSSQLVLSASITSIPLWMGWGQGAWQLLIKGGGINSFPSPRNFL